MTGATAEMFIHLYFRCYPHFSFTPVFVCQILMLPRKFKRRIKEVLWGDQNSRREEFKATGPDYPKYFLSHCTWWKFIKKTQFRSYVCNIAICCLSNTWATSGESLKNDNIAHTSQWKQVFWLLNKRPTVPLRSYAQRREWQWDRASCPVLQRKELFLKGACVSSHPNRSAPSFTLGQEPLPNPCLEPDLSFTQWSWDRLISVLPLSSAFQEEMVHYIQNPGTAGKEDICTNIAREVYMYYSAGLSVDIGQPSFPNRRAYREKAEITSPSSCNWIELSSHRTTAICHKFRLMLGLLCFLCFA